VSGAGPTALPPWDAGTDRSTSAPVPSATTAGTCDGSHRMSF
jgi:hypothetical protein